MSVRIFIPALMILLIVSVNGSAQTLHQYYPSPSDSSVGKQIGTDVSKYNRIDQVVQGSGRSYSGAQIQQMAAKDINQIANTVPGVQYRAGEPLIIRGTSIGTAYFVDGVRVYGALPVLSK